MSAFAGVKCLNSESRVLGNEYLAWIFGFGIGGLVLFSCALTVSADGDDPTWLSAQMPLEQYKLLVISIGSGFLLIPSLLTGILTIGFSAGTLGLYVLVPFTVLLWLFPAVRFALRSGDDAKNAGLPILVNSMVICLVVLLYWANSRIEFGFRW